MLYPNSIESKLGFDVVRTMLKAHCLSRMGVERVDAMTFSPSPSEVRLRLRVLNDMARLMLGVAAAEGEDAHAEDGAMRALPDEDFVDIRTTLHKIRLEGSHAECQELWELLRSLRTLHSWLMAIGGDTSTDSSPQPSPALSPAQSTPNTTDPSPSIAPPADLSPYPALRGMAEGVVAMPEAVAYLDRLLDRYGHLRDTASTELARIRNEIRLSEGSANRLLASVLEGAKREGLVEGHVMPTVREGRLMIPISRDMKRRIRGIVHDESASGKTVFVEPAEVVEANNRIRELEAEERRETIRILRDVTAWLRPLHPQLVRAMEFLADVEFTLAKHRLGVQMGGVVPRVGDKPMVDWIRARHPLLDLALRRQGREVVPLDIRLTPEERILVISGPNAGGKSVCLKTVGLLQYMLQCGLAVPMGEESRVGVFSDIFIDIGDEQSIENDLSTYSSHLLNMKTMMRGCSGGSLVLVDEMGGGTEPTIGGAIAEAVLKRIVERRAYGVVTTHYQNLKLFASRTRGVVNGAMLYDRQQMRPLFQLAIGHPGSSFAVEIARKTGLPEDVIREATEMVGKDYVQADKFLLDIVRDKRYWEGKRQAIHEKERDVELARERYEREVAELRERRRDILQEASEQAEQLLRESNARIERTIREIREANAEKERTREVRRELEGFKEVVASGSRTEGGKATEGDRAGKVTVGSTVRIKGQTSVGTVTGVKGKRATVVFGLMRTNVELSRLEPAKPPAPQKGQGTGGGEAVRVVSRLTQEQMHRAQMGFSQQLDVRGMRGTEALQAVTYYIDDAILLGASQVRILHGTGTGALREIIRQYLGTVPQVASAHDENVQFGGAGITVVELTY